MTEAADLTPGVEVADLTSGAKDAGDAGLPKVNAIKGTSFWSL